VPPQGEPLLNDFELDTSHQFFDKFQNGQFADEAKLFDSLGSFHQDPIPSLHSVSSTMGQPQMQRADASHGLNFGLSDHDLSLRFDQANLSSPHAENFTVNDKFPFHPAGFATYDVRRSGHPRHHSDAFGTHNSHHAPGTIVSRADFSRQSAPAINQGSLVFGGDHSFSEINSISEAQQQLPTAISPGHTATKAIAPALGFGSDQDFRSQTYIPPRRTQEELKSAEQTVEDNMIIFEAHKHDSTDNTAASSPILTKLKRRLSEDAAGVSRSISIGRKGDGSHGSHALVSDKRQRKVKVEDDAEDPDIAVSVKPRITKKGRANSKVCTMSEGAASHGARRKSQSGEKPSRQNLTEEEKKQNHIRSEQKRRNQIKDGFTNLVALMPEGTPAGSSKCAILSHAVDWLSDMIEGNEKLRSQLKELGG
jgi:hypothetical protein